MSNQAKENIKTYYFDKVTVGKKRLAALKVGKHGDEVANFEP